MQRQSPRPTARYPAQINFQTPDAMRDDVDAVAILSQRSRADIIRECIARALDQVADEHGVRPRERRALLLRRQHGRESA